MENKKEPIERGRYELSYEQVEELTKATKRAASYEQAKELTRFVWERIAKEKNVYVETIGPDPEDPQNPKIFRAVSKDEDLSKMDKHLMGIPIEDDEEE